MAGGLVAPMHVCLAGLGKALKESGCGGGCMLNAVKTPGDRHANFVECVGEFGGSLCHEGLTALD